MTTIAIVGAGAMGSAIARRLTQRGATVIARLDGRDDPAAAAIWRALARFYAERAAANEAGTELPKLEAILAS